MKKHDFILVTLLSDSGAPTSYISYTGNYDDLNTRKMLQIKLASIYNYLKTINFPIASTLTLSRGRLLMRFEN